MMSAQVDVASLYTYLYFASDRRESSIRVRKVLLPNCTEKFFLPVRVNTSCTFLTSEIICLEWWNSNAL